MYSGEFAEPRLIHSKGFIQLCIDKSATDNTGSFLSVGTDGDVWIWTGDELDEAEYYAKNIKGRTHSAIAWHGNNIYIGHTSADNQTGIQKSTVSRFEKDSLRMIAPITTFSLDLSSIDISKSGKFLAAGSIDHVLKIINLETGDVIRAEADGQIMCVSFNSKDEYLAVTATDGMLRVFDITLPKGELPEPVTIRICSRIVDIEPSNSKLQLCWDPFGDNLFVPAFGCVKKFDKHSFEEITKFFIGSNSYDMFSVCCVSSCGTYLASSTMNGLICVWQIDTGDLLTCSKYQINGQPKVICTMFWHRSLRDTLFFADTEEHICSLNKCTRKVTSNECNSTDLDLQCVRNKAAVKFYDDENSQNLDSIKKSYGFDEEGHFRGIFDESEENSHIFTTAEPSTSYKPVVVPKAFVTGCTPEHRKQRYLKWNQYGTIISSYNGDDGRIEINWHDTSIHPEIIIDNTANFSIGDMNDEIVALASKVGEESLSEMQVQCVKAWDYGSRQWSVKLPEGESVENIVIGRTFLVLATSQRYFRTFSYAGTQKMVFCYSGPLFTMCAFNDMFTAVMLNGGAYYENNEPQFNFVANIYKMKTEDWHKCQSLVQTVPISVGRNAKLNWIGYTSRGTLCTMDSKYCCRIFSSNGIWIPVYDFATTLKSNSDHIFLISFMDYPHCEIRYIYCRGIEYPLVESRPIPAVVKWQLPLCNQDTEKSKLEEKLLLAEIRSYALNSDDEDKKESELLDISATCTKDVVRLFALACRADRQCRAAEFATYTHSGQIIQSMCNFASKTRHPLLAEKVAEIGRINAVAQQDVTRDEHERKRNILLEDKKKSDFLAPKRLKKDRISDEVVVKAVQERAEQEENEHVQSLDTTLSNEYSSFLSPVQPRLPSNPFKRKSQNTFGLNQDNFFDSLASASSTTSRKTSDDISDWKKMKREPSKIRQTSLSVKLNEEKGMSEAKIGFDLWLKSMESKLRRDYDGYEDFLEYAIKQFRHLKTEEKRHWNDLAQASKT